MTGVSFEWGALIIVVAGLSVLSGLIANGVKIWRDTRPVPPIGDQISRAIDRHEKDEGDRAKTCKESNRREFERLEKRVDSNSRNIGNLEVRVAGLDERTRGRRYDGQKVWGEREG